MSYLGRRSRWWWHLGQGPAFLTHPGPSAEQHQWARGSSPPPSPKPPCPLIRPLPRLSGPTAQVGTPPERPPLKEKKIHLDCTLLFIAYFVLSVVDNSLLSYIKKYLNDVQYAMP